MGFFDVKWIVEIEYSDGFLQSNKTDFVVVDAPNDYKAKQIVKNDPKYHHKYLRIKSVKRYDSKTNVEVQETIYESEPLTEQERVEIHARWEELEHQGQTKRKQRAISVQQSKVNKINRSPVIAGVVAGIITLFLFLLGWIPYWVWDYRRAACKSSLEQMFEWGHTMNEPVMQELYADGLHAKEMRNSVIWIPFVILAIGIVATIVVVVLVNKSKPKRLFEARKELASLSD